MKLPGNSTLLPKWIRQGRTPFYMASKNGHATIVEFLLGQGPSLGGEKKRSRETPREVEGGSDVVTGEMAVS